MPKPKRPETEEQRRRRGEYEEYEKACGGKKPKRKEEPSRVLVTSESFMQTGSNTSRGQLAGQLSEITQADVESLPKSLRRRGVRPDELEEMLRQP